MRVKRGDGACAPIVTPPSPPFPLGAGSKACALHSTQRKRRRVALNPAKNMQGAYAVASACAPGTAWQAVGRHSAASHSAEALTSTPGRSVFEKNKDSPARAAAARHALGPGCCGLPWAGAGRPARRWSRPCCSTLASCFCSRCRRARSGSRATPRRASTCTAARWRSSAWAAPGGRAAAKAAGGCCAPCERGARLGTAVGDAAGRRRGGADRLAACCCCSPARLGRLALEARRMALGKRCSRAAAHRQASWRHWPYEGTPSSLGRSGHCASYK